MPMIDFFLWALGIPPIEVPSDEKRNHWLKSLPLPAWPSDRAGYVLFCPNASTPVRSIPPSLHREMVARLHDDFGVPVVGFAAVDHPHYTDITPLAPDTADFLNWVKHARYLVTSDTAALHIAAGFDVPTTAFFTTIPPAMRARDYADCHAVSVPVPGLAGIQASARPGDLAALERAYQAVLAEQVGPLHRAPRIGA